MDKLAWGLAVCLLFFTVGSATRPNRQLPDRLDLSNGFTVRELRARSIENTTAGPLLVISGSLRNSGPSPKTLHSNLTIELRDEAGSAIPAGRRRAGVALPIEVLREMNLSALHGLQRRGAHELTTSQIEPGAELPFDVVFDSGFVEARDFTVLEEAPGGFPLEVDPAGLRVPVRRAAALAEARAASEAAGEAAVSVAPSAAPPLPE